MCRVLLTLKRSRHDGLLRLAIALLLLLSSASVLLAQSTSAFLAGRVVDPSNAVIPGATITAINGDTNTRHVTTTNDAGEYYLANLPPRSYRIEVEKPGFRTLVKPDVVLQVQDTLQLDFQMTLGSVSEVVTVDAGAPLVNTTSGAVSTVIDRTFVDNLPLNGRSFQTLIMLTPGTVVVPTAFNDQGQFSVNGQRADANYFMVDGVSANFGVTGYFPMMQTAGGALPALSANGGTNSLVSVDAMQEFRIQTSSFAPEFGRTPGGQISIVTRSGSNAFRGSVFEYFRNDALDAKDWFVNFSGLPKPEQQLHDFGGVVGGPLHANATFFFYSHEGLRLHQPSSMQTSVPDAASRQQAPAVPLQARRLGSRVAGCGHATSGVLCEPAAAQLSLSGHRRQQQRCMERDGCVDRVLRGAGILPDGVVSCAPRRHDFRARLDCPSRPRPHRRKARA